MLQLLKDISNNRMPSVADLLKQAAQAPKQSQPSGNNKTAMAGQVRASAPGKAGEGAKKPASPAQRGSFYRRCRIVPAAAETQGGAGCAAQSKGQPPHIATAEYDAGRRGIQARRSATCE